MLLINASVNLLEKTALNYSELSQVAHTSILNLWKKKGRFNNGNMWNALLCVAWNKIGFLYAASNKLNLLVFMTLKSCQIH